MPPAGLVTLRELADLAIGTPEVGAVNFNALHTLLVALLKNLNMQDTRVDYQPLSERRLSAFARVPLSTPRGSISTPQVAVSKERRRSSVTRVPSVVLESQVKGLGGQVQNLDGQVQNLDGQVQDLDRQLKTMDTQMQGVLSHIQYFTSLVGGMDSETSEWLEEQAKAFGLAEGLGAERTPLIIEPGASITEPGASITEPGASITERGASMAERGALMTEKGASVAERGAPMTERGASMAERGAPMTERGASMAERGASMAERGASMTERGASMAERGASMAERGASVAERGAPMAERGASMAERGAPVAERGASMAERGASMAERGAPVAERGAPMAERGASMAERGTSMAERGAPMAERGASMAERGTSMAERGAPMAERGTSMAERGAPMAERGTSMAERGAPMAERGTSMAERGTSMAERGTSMAERGAPMAERGTSMAERGAPMTERGASIAERGAPMTEKGTPTMEKGALPKTKLVPGMGKAKPETTKPLPGVAPPTPGMPTTVPGMAKQMPEKTRGLMKMWKEGPQVMELLQQVVEDVKILKEEHARAQDVPEFNPLEFLHRVEEVEKRVKDWEEVLEPLCRKMTTKPPGGEFTMVTWEELEQAITDGWKASQGLETMPAILKQKGKPPASLRDVSPSAASTVHPGADQALDAAGGLGPDQTLPGPGGSRHPSEGEQKLPSAPGFPDREPHHPMGRDEAGLARPHHLPAPQFTTEADQHRPGERPSTAGPRRDERDAHPGPVRQDLHPGAPGGMTPSPGQVMDARPDQLGPGPPGLDQLEFQPPSAYPAGLPFQRGPMPPGMMEQGPVLPGMGQQAVMPLWAPARDQQGLGLPGPAQPGMVPPGAQQYGVRFPGPDPRAMERPALDGRGVGPVGTDEHGFPIFGVDQQGLVPPLRDQQGFGQPGLETPGFIQPGTLQYNVLQPGAAQPGLVPPGAGQPGLVPPGAGQPGLVPPGVDQRGFVQPGAYPYGLAQPGVYPHGFMQPGVAGQPGLVPPGVGQPGLVQPGVGQPGFVPPGAGQPGFIPPGAGQPGLVPPGVGQPGLVQPGAGQPGFVPPGAGQPGLVPPGAGQPGLVPPGAGQPGLVPPGVGQPGLVPPGAGQPGLVPPGVGQPGLVPPGVGQPGLVPPGVGQPGLVQPGMDQRGSVQPGADQPGLVQPGVDQRGLVQPGAYPPGFVQPGAYPPGFVQPGAYPPGFVQPDIDQQGLVEPGLDQHGLRQPGADHQGLVPSGAEPHGSPRRYQHGLAPPGRDQHGQVSPRLSRQGRMSPRMDQEGLVPTDTYQRGIDQGGARPEQQHWVPPDLDQRDRASSVLDPHGLTYPGPYSPRYSGVDPHDQAPLDPQRSGYTQPPPTPNVPWAQSVDSLSESRRASQEPSTIEPKKHDSLEKVAPSFPIAVETFRLLGELIGLYSELKENMKTLDVQKAGQTDLEKIQYLLAMMVQKTIPPDLQEQLKSIKTLTKEVRQEKAKLDKIQRFLEGGGLPEVGKEVAAGPLSFQLGLLRVSVNDIEKELSDLRESQEQGKVTMEHSVSEASLYLQNQLDKLRTIIENMLASSSTLLTMSMTPRKAPITLIPGQIDPKATCPACSLDLSHQVSTLVQRYEQLQHVVTSLAASRPSKKAKLQRQDEELLGHVQSAILQVQGDCEKLNLITGNLIEDHRQKQKDIDVLYQGLEKLEKEKVNRGHLELEIEVKADKSALEAKVSRMQFDATTEQLNHMMQELVAKMSGQERDWQKMLDRLLTEMDSKLDRLELDPVKQLLEDRWKSLRQQLKERSPLYQADEAAGMRRQLLAHFHCLSCDRPLETAVTGQVLPTTPVGPSLPGHRSTRPYTVFELEQVRQQSRSLKLGNLAFPRADLASMERSVGRLHTMHSKMLMDIEKVQFHYGGAVKASSQMIHELLQAQCLGSPCCKRVSEMTDYSFATVSRHCGGSHTLTYPYRRTRLQHLPQGLLPEDSQVAGKHHEVDILGLDGHIYKGRMDMKLPGIPNKDSAGNNKHKTKPSRSHAHRPLALGDSPLPLRPQSANMMAGGTSATSRQHTDRPVSSQGRLSQPNVGHPPSPSGMAMHMDMPPGEGMEEPTRGPRTPSAH